MKIRTFFTITGRIATLIKNYNIKEKEFLNITRNNKKELSFYIDGSESAEIDQIENIIKNLQNQGHKIQLDTYQRVLKFDETDFEDKLLIKVSFGNIENMTGFRELPVSSHTCKHYNHLVYQNQNLKKISLVLWDSITWIEKFNEYLPLMIFSNLINIIHIDLIEELNSQGLNKGMKLSPISLEIPDEGKTIEDQYFWIYSDENIGNLTGKVKLGKYRSNCVHPEIIENKNLIETYARSNYKDQDFCISNYSGVVTLFISHRVYQFFKEKIDSNNIPKDMISFTPILLS